MGPTKQVGTTNATTQSQPWGPTLPALDNILQSIPSLPNPLAMTATEGGAFNGLLQNAYSGNPYSAPVGDLTTKLLSNGGDYLQPYLTMDTNPYNNPAFNAQLQTLTNDTTNNIKSQYAGAGYSPTSSGDFPVQLGRGIAQGIAPTAVQAQEYLTNLKMGAGQQQLSNELTGASLAPTALAMRDSPYTQLLNVASQIRGFPLQNLAQQEGLVLPMAQLGGTSNTSGTTTSSTQVPLMQQLLGAGIGGLGLAGATGGFGPSGWLYGGPSSLFNFKG